MKAYGSGKLNVSGGGVLVAPVLTVRALSRLALVATLWSACGSPSRPADAGPDALGSGLTACESNRDCGGGEVCRGGYCRTSCESRANCEAPLGVCDATLAYCVECSADTDCRANRACVESACVFYCREDAACGPDEYCVTATGRCAARECERTADCAGGFRCERFVCVPIDNLVCEPRSEACSGSATVVRCNADGTMEAMEGCASGSVCVEDAAGAACRAVLCAPSEVGCLDGATAFECDATGTVRTETPCPAGQYCGAGVCQERVCEPSSVRCEGGGVVTCDALGSVQSFEACADRPECAGSAYGCACASGACLARICTPGGTRCAAMGVQTCAADGRSWGSTMSCPAGQTCLVALGACATVMCTAGSRECFGEVLSECNGTGTMRTTTDCAASGRLCTGTGAGAGCTARACTPGALRCDGFGTAVLECDARGAGETTTACPSGQNCRDGACLALLCAPGSAAASCASATSRSVCASDGLSYTASPCAAGQSCTAGVCAVRCGDGIVGVGESCDDGNTVSGDGCSSACAGERPRSCRERLMAVPGSPSGVYTIDPDGTGPNPSLRVYCDMTSDGGGWTMIVAQFEAFPETNWNRGTTATYSPDGLELCADGACALPGRSFALSTEQIPPHTQTAFGRGTNATFVDYANFIYTTGSVSASLVGLRTGSSFQVHRDPARYYDSHDPESPLRTVCEGWCDTLTFDRSGGVVWTWAFSPNRPDAASRGCNLLGLRSLTTEPYAWTVWVR